MNAESTTFNRFMLADSEQKYRRKRLGNEQPKRVEEIIHIEFAVFAWWKHLTDYWLHGQPVPRVLEQ